MGELCLRPLIVKLSGYRILTFREFRNTRNNWGNCDERFRCLLLSQMRGSESSKAVEASLSDAHFPQNRIQHSVSDVGMVVRSVCARWESQALLFVHEGDQMSRYSGMNIHHTICIRRPRSTPRDSRHRFFRRCRLKMSSRVGPPGEPCPDSAMANRFGRAEVSLCQPGSLDPGPSAQGAKLR